MAFFGEMVSEIWWLGRWCFRKYLASLLVRQVRQVGLIKTNVTFLR